MDKKQLIKELVDLSQEKVTREYIEKVFYNDILNEKFAISPLYQYYIDVRDDYSKYDGAYLLNKFCSNYNRICYAVAKAKSVPLEDISDTQILEFCDGNPKDAETLKKLIGEFAEQFTNFYNETELNEENVASDLGVLYAMQMKYLVSDLDKQEKDELAWNIFADLSLNELKKYYVASAIKSSAPQIMQTFNTFDVDDCKQSLFNVSSSQDYSRYSYLYDIAENLKKGKSRFKRNVSAMVFEALSDKLRKLSDPEYKFEMLRNNKNFMEFAESYGRRYNHNIVDYICDNMMDYFNINFYHGKISEDFINKFAEQARTPRELQSLFQSIYNVVNFRFSNKSMENIISDMGKYLKDYMAEQEKMDKITNFATNNSDMMSYARSKAGDLVLEKLLEVEDDNSKEDGATSKLQLAIDSMSNEKAEELDRSIIKYVQDQIVARTGHEFIRDALSKEFINKHKRELIEIVSSSTYDDETVIQMLKDIIIQSELEEKDM